MDRTPDIFVSIASYRDPELIPTLRDMINNAANPQSLHIAVCWQDEEDFSVFTAAGFSCAPPGYSPREDERLFYYRGAAIFVIYRHYLVSEGACWARHLSEALYDNEDFFLQIDSHCRFIKSWDQEMISMLEDLSILSPLPVISAYPPAYEPGENEEKSKQQFVNRMVLREFSREGIPMGGSKSFTATRPLRGSYMAGGFIFSRGSFVKDVANDPQIFFAGEEIAMAVRAFTCGYDIYHPHKLLLWHYYQRSNSAKIWQDHSNEAKQQGTISHAWWERDRRSKQRIRTLLGLNDEPVETLFPYGPGTQRTLRQFEYQTGLHLRTQSTQPAVTDSTQQAFFAAPPENEALWLASFSVWHYKKLILPVSELDDLLEDNHYIQLGVYDSKNHLLFSSRLAPQSLQPVGDSGSVPLTIKFSTRTSCKPATIRLCGWQDSSGWGRLTEKSW